MNCCIKDHKDHNCDTCKHKDVYLFDDPCKKCLVNSVYHYAEQGECAYREDFSKYWNKVGEK